MYIKVYGYQTSFNTRNYDTIIAVCSLDYAEEHLEEITHNVRGFQSQAQVEHLNARQALGRGHTVSIMDVHVHSMFSCHRTTSLKVRIFIYFELYM